MKPKYKQIRIWFKLKVAGGHIIVKPVNGEKSNQVSGSAGLVHYKIKDGVRPDYEGFCGIDYFEKNATKL